MPFLNRTRFDELKTTGHLPSPEGVALAIIGLTQREDVRIEELTRLIQSDPAIAGRVLKYANTANRGDSRPIVSLSRAVIFLGIFRVRQLVLGFSLLNGHRKGECKNFDYQDFWSRSLATAIASQEISRYAQTAAEESFTCGLLAGVGRLALATLFPDEYSNLLSRAREAPPECLARLEQESFGMDHRQLTAALLEDWGLPTIFVEAVFHHENPGEADFPCGSRAYILTHALAFSANVARICVAEEQERWHLLPGLFNLGARLGLDAETVTDTFDRVASQWREWGELLDVPTLELPPVAELAAAFPGQQEARPSREAAGAHPAPLPLRILVAGDDPGVIPQLAKTLTAHEHIVTTVSKGASVLAQIQQLAPQLIICDWVLPDMDALAFCKELRQRRGGQEIYLIVLTSRDYENNLPRVFEAGADDYLPKPFNDQVLLARLRTAQRVLHLREEIQIERLGVLRAADEWASTSRRLLEAAMTDPLTKLPNRRYGMDRLSQEWLFSCQSGRPLSCFLLDIDHFKRINDSLGHDAGDAVLLQVASILTQTSRREDIVFRYGGEEFLSICPDTGPQEAALAAERIRKAVESAVFRSGTRQFRVTVSIGVATRQPSMASVEEMVKGADQALYQAKQAGRNRVMVHG
jgi:diguanylate cyclase (GGDEF)-like protein